MGVAGGVGRLAEIGDSHASGKGAGKLDVDGCFTGLDDIRIDEIGDGARVVNRWVIEALVGLVGLAEEAKRPTTNSETGVSKVLISASTSGVASAWWVRSKPTMTTGQSSPNTIAAASGSTAMLNSADGE